jgi:hypothetical protein
MELELRFGGIIEPTTVGERNQYATIACSQVEYGETISE